MPNNLLRRAKESFPALKYRNFRLFFTGQGISLIGTWMQNIAQPWLVLRLTNSPLLLGLVVTFQTLPQMLFSLFVGPLIDSLPKRKILIFTQTCFMILAVILGLLASSKYLRYWHVLVISALFGVLNTIDMPTRQAYMVELVGKEDLMNAIGLNSSMFNLTRIIGPTLGGVLIGIVGLPACFYINAVSFLAVIIQLIKINTVEFNINQTKISLKNLWKDSIEGIKYIFKIDIIREVIIFACVVSIFAINFGVLVPVFTKNVLNLGASGFGLLMAAMGVGALAGALIVALNKNKKPKLSTIIFAGFSFSISLILLNFARNVYISAILLILTGLFMILFITSINTLIQLESEDSFRGRVMCVFSFVFVGVAPIGSLYTGIIANKFGSNFTFGISGIIALITTIVIFFRSKSIKQ
jgi:MFS family permease